MTNSYILDLETKLSEYDKLVTSYEQSRAKITGIHTTTTYVAINNKKIQGTPNMSSTTPTQDACKTSITNPYKSASYDKNGNCSLFTTDTPILLEAADSAAIIDDIYNEKNNFKHLSSQLSAKCDELIKILNSPDYDKMYGNIIQNNAMFLKELKRMSSQLATDRDEINKGSLTFEQEMDELEKTQKNSELTAESNYYISSLLMLVVVVCVIIAIYMLIPNGTSSSLQSGGRNLSSQSYFMIASLIFASIIIYQLKFSRSYS